LSSAEKVKQNRYGANEPGEKGVVSEDGEGPRAVTIYRHLKKLERKNKARKEKGKGGIKPPGKKRKEGGGKQWGNKKRRTTPTN